MLQKAYDKKILTGIGVVTFLSLASMSSNIPGNSVTIGTNNEYGYEGISFVKDKEGDMCISSAITNISIGDVAINPEIMDFMQKRERNSIEIQVTHIRKHVSKFDFQDEYEEI